MKIGSFKRFDGKSCLKHRNLLTAQILQHSSSHLPYAVWIILEFDLKELAFFIKPATGTTVVRMRVHLHTYRCDCTEPQCLCLNNKTKKYSQVGLLTVNILKYFNI